ncbi:hypothetical protein JCM9803A_02410 [Rhodococcus erythropolis]
MTTAGYDKASISTICRDSGLPVGSIYHHFGSKAALGAEVIQRLERPFFVSLPLAGEGDADILVTLAAFWSAAIDAILRNYGFFKLSAELLILSRDDVELRKLMERQSRSSQASIVKSLLRVARIDTNSEAWPALSTLSRVIITYTRGALMSSAGDHQLLRREMENFYPILSAAFVALGHEQD